MGLRNSLCRWSTLLALAAVSLALPALAGDNPAAAAPPAQAAAQTPAEAAPPVAAAGLVAYIDPATGGLTAAPTEEQRAAMRTALAALVNDSGEGLVEVRLPDGSVVMDLQGRFQEAVVVQVAPDATRHMQCIGNLPDVAATPSFAPAPAPPAAAVAE
jgi:hypothetical protein